MTIYVQNVGRVRSATEPNGSFATEISIGTFQDVTLIEGTQKFTLDKPYETPKLLQQYLYGYPSKVPMPKRATFSFSTNMRGATTRAASTLQHNATTSIPDYNLFSTAFRGVIQATGTTVATTSTTTVINATSAAGFPAGGALACATGPGGALECREIKSITSNAITLKSALSAIPANASTVYGCTTFYLAALDGSLATSLQVAIEGLNTADRWLLKGGQVSAAPAFKLAPGSIPTVDWAWQFAQHFQANGTETTMNLNAALADQSYSDVGINAVMDSEFRLTPHVSTTGIVVDAAEINILPNFSYEPQLTPGGTNNIKQWVASRVEGPPATANFLVPYEDATWRTARDAETAYALTYQVGSSVANGGFMLSLPFVTIDDFQRDAQAGLAGQRIQCFARQDTQSVGSTALQLSPIKIHIM